MAILKVSTAYTRMFLMVQTADHITGLTGAAPSVTLSKAGGTFAAAGGVVTEVASGWYKIALTTTDTNTLGELAFHITAALGDPTDFADQVTTNNLNNDLSIDASGNVNTTANIKKNTAQAGFMFVMTNSTTHAPQTGLTVTATRSLDGGAFAGCANAVTEVGNGWYTISLAASDTNANHIGLRFTAAAADDLNIEIITQP